MKFADIAGAVLAIVEKLAEIVLERSKAKHPKISPSEVLAIVREHEAELAGAVMNIVLAKLADRAAQVPAAIEAAEARGKAAGDVLRQYVQRVDEHGDPIK